METKISLCMIVRDEERVLGRCLESVKEFVDEIIVVDTGSKDRTKVIAKKFTDKVFDFVWIDDFSAARNFAFSKATGRYLFWLDADDVVSESELKKLVKLKETLDDSVDVFMMKYVTAFDENQNPKFTYFRERLLKNDGSFFWEGAVHEVISPHGKIHYVDISIFHKKEKSGDPKRNLRIYQKLIKKRPLNSREKYYFARELYYNNHFKKAISVLNDFLKGEAWIEDKLGALEIKAACENAIFKDKNPALATLFESFKLAPPRANFLCQIGDIFFSDKKFEQCIFFYENALRCKKNYESGAFIVEDYFSRYPALQLCLAYYNLDQIDMAIKFNDLALSFDKKDPVATHNKQFFDQLMGLK